jgi:transcriptional regulator with XRE-family HTH domain
MDHGSNFRDYVKHPPRPHACLEHKPTRQSVLFCSTFINLSLIAFMSGLTLSYISMIFAGKRSPSLRSARLIAKALNMGLEEFLKGLDDHVEIIHRFEHTPPRQKVVNL